jgi:hypothetical protein
MKFQRREGVSVIIATLLLIAITVAAGIIVYVFVNGLAGNLTTGGGQQATERLQVQSYNFALSPQACACSAQFVQLFLLNSGSSATTISAVYFDGVLQTTLSAASQSNAALATGTAYTAGAAAIINDYTTTCSATNGAAGSICFSIAGAKTTYAVGDTGQLVIGFSAAVTAGSAHTVKVISTTGATYVFSVTAGRQG